MKCEKCGQTIPNDSEFCQYCGYTIKKEQSHQNIPFSQDSMSAQDFIHTLMKMQAQETASAMKANQTEQPDFEKDEDFGLVSHKPIYTLAVDLVKGEKEYLSRLRTTNGEKISWERRGSVSVDGINGMIDIYDIFLPSGTIYKTIYLNMYGAKKSEKAPVGFVFSDAQRDTKGSAVNKPEPSIQTRDKFLKRCWKNIVFAVLCVLCGCLVAVCIWQYIHYQNLSKDMQIQLSELNDTVLSQKSEVASLEEKVEMFEKVISIQEDALFSASEKAEYIEHTIQFAESGNFGYAAENFRASTGVIIVSKEDYSKKFTLTAYWPNGGSVFTEYSSDSARVEFDSDSWSRSTNVSVLPREDGVTVVTFHNDVDYQTFQLLIIVTD